MKINDENQMDGVNGGVLGEGDAGIISNDVVGNEAGPVVELNVSNAEFIKAVFHTVPEGASPLVCSKVGDPTAGGWMPKRADDVGQWCLPGSNNYINCASFHPDVDGTVSARKDKAAAFHSLMLDDFGTKVPLAHLGEIKPSWMLETSPGNYQVGFILATPLTDQEQVQQLQNAAIAKELCDPGAKGMARWSRLPVGINGKAKYLSTSGETFRCKLVVWNSEARYTLDELVAGFKLELHPVPSQQLGKPASSPTAIHTETESLTVAQLAKRLKLCENLLEPIDPGCKRDPWMDAMMAVFQQTQGSAAGFELFDRWSSGGSNYPGTGAINVQWRSLRLDTEKKVNLGTLIWMAKNAGADTATILDKFGDDAFEPCDTEVIYPDGKPATKAVERAPDVPAIPATPTPARGAAGTHPLSRYSLLGYTAELERQMVEQIAFLGSIGLLGQATVIYAQANTGKTLIILHLIIRAIRLGLVDPAKVFYINMDDNSTGLVEKNLLAEEYGFNMLADGHQGFHAELFPESMEQMIEDNSVGGAIVILDTLKKFTNTMDKTKSSAFAGVVRRFVMKGGTVVALAHTNKNPGADGKAIYAGTADIVQDFDCAYMLEAVSQHADPTMKVIEFTNIKRRGNVALSAAYSYPLERGLPYNELLLSVQEVDPNQLAPIKQAAELQSDATVIAAIHACIAQGITSKMRLAYAAAESAQVSRKQALRIVEKYTGEDLAQHQWRYVVRERGAKVFESLKPPPAEDPGMASTKAP
ncbi:MAG: PriCT-2 domain-containing protein [Bifidobacterium adolescentis]